MAVDSVSIALTGSGGSGVMTAGQMLLESAAKAGYYGLMTRSSGPQIRGGEAAAFIRLSSKPVGCPDDRIDVLFAFDWKNIERFEAEIPLDADSLVIGGVGAGDVPDMVTNSGATLVEVPLAATAKSIPGGRPNMVALGILSKLASISEDAVSDVINRNLARKGQDAVDSSIATVKAGIEVAGSIESNMELPPPSSAAENHWSITGNDAAGLGALRGGIKFVAAYPITPATEILEWLAPNLEKVGGCLVQAEDELASINMIIGGSFGGVPALTATSGPGLALMTEALGLAVASEVPIVVVDVMRGGPSTGIPTKSEQSDLNIALYGLHGDAPHLVTAANSISDCLFTTQWSVHLAEAMQTAAIVLSEQSLGQSRQIVDKPADVAFIAKRELMAEGTTDYTRYAITASGVSPMAVPGMAGGEYVADGLEHTVTGRPSSEAGDHDSQLDKRDRKLKDFDYGDHWADIVGEDDSEMVIVTWGSTTVAVLEACERIRAAGGKTRVVSLRLLMPALVDKFAEAIKGAKRMLVVEQTHSRQFYQYLRANYDLPNEVKVFNRPGPLPFRPGELVDQIKSWS